MLTTPAGSSACRQMSAKRSAVSGVVSAGLRTTVLPHASAGAIFHASISSGKFHGMICAGDAERARLAVRERVLELVGPARVVEEVRRGERDVDVARLLDRLAAVQRLRDRELARALLDQARDPEQVLRPLGGPAASTSRPRTPRAPPGRRGRRRAAPARATSASCSSVAGEIVGKPFPRARRDLLAADEEAVALLEARRCRAPRARARSPTRAGTAGCASRSLVTGRPPSVDREVVAGLVGAGPLLADLHQHVVEQRRGAEAEQVGRQPRRRRASR